MKQSSSVAFFKTGADAARAALSAKLADTPPADENVATGKLALQLAQELAHQLQGVRSKGTTRFSPLRSLGQTATKAIFSPDSPIAGVADFLRLSFDAALEKTAALKDPFDQETRPRARLAVKLVLYMLLAKRGLLPVPRPCLALVKDLPEPTEATKEPWWVAARSILDRYDKKLNQLRLSTYVAAKNRVGEQAGSDFRSMMKAPFLKSLKSIRDDPFLCALASGSLPQPPARRARSRRR